MTISQGSPPWLPAAFGNPFLPETAASAEGDPRLSGEYVVVSNLEFVRLAATEGSGRNTAAVSARPPWAIRRVVKNEAAIGLNDDMASRGVRCDVHLVRRVAAKLDECRVSA